MDDILKDDTFLARWASGKLTAGELDAFQKHPQYSQYQKILKASDNLIAPSVDLDVVLEDIKSKRSKDSKTSTIVPIRRSLVVGIAAAILLMISGYFFLNTSEVNFKAGIGEQLAIDLPDGSTLILNSSSSVQYDKNSFINNRKLDFQGEGYFDVIKGGSFKVNTPNGNIQVLGTSFNVLNRQNVLQVSCKTGKVKVENLSGNTIILNQGDRVRIEDGKLGTIENINSNSISNWQEGESKFERIPLIDVISALEHQFGLDIEINKEKGKDTFTGGFIHSNLDLAQFGFSTRNGFHAHESEI
jgi:ferric-dicitrate binding protein FerR (iron transport regulator)